MTSSPNILIARMSAVGDTVLTLPVLCALREHLPRAFIAWVVEETAAPVLRGHPSLDRLIVLPRRWFLSPRAVWRLRRELRGLRIDVALDCQSVTKSAVACWLSGARTRIGLDGEYGRELAPRLDTELVLPEAPHVVDRSLALLRPLGIARPGVRFEISVDEDAADRMAAFVEEGGCGERFVLMNPGASWESKLWPPERYADVARYLATEHGLASIIVWGGERERFWAEAIVSQADGKATLAPRTDLRELAALARKAAFFLGSDTGPLHLAAAIGTPCVGLYGATRPQDCGPYGLRHIALQERYHEGTRRERKRADNRAMRLITVERVCRACDEILAREGSASAPEREAADERFTQSPAKSSAEGS